MAVKTWALGHLHRFVVGRFTGNRSVNSAVPEQKAPAIPSTPKRVNKLALDGIDCVSPKNAKGLVNQLKSTGRYVVLLMPRVIDNLRPAQLGEFIDVLDREMSLVDKGPVSVEYGSLDDEPDVAAHVEIVESFFIDRFTVTNAEFKQFVEQGGYETEQLWAPEVLPAIAEFVDTTGRPGPRSWANGTYPSDLSEHPVVGVSWHEANAYARWAGKRLPTSAEWVKAASWPLVSAGQPTRQRIYPWGNIFEESNANVWVTGLNHPVRVDEFQDGNNASDVCQMSGNVWEWMADDFSLRSGDKLVVPETATKSIRGGAFDTYVERQASCQFESGDNPFSRRHNIGFRCVVSYSHLADEARAKIKQRGIKSRSVSLPVSASSQPAANSSPVASSSPPSHAAAKEPSTGASPPPTSTAESIQKRLEREVRQQGKAKKESKQTDSLPKSNSRFAGLGDDQ